jgi:hypothetical protein
MSAFGWLGVMCVESPWKEQLSRAGEAFGRALSALTLWNADKEQETSAPGTGTDVATEEGMVFCRASVPVPRADAVLQVGLWARPTLAPIRKPSGSSALPAGTAGSTPAGCGLWSSTGGDRRLHPGRLRSLEPAVLGG